LPYQFWIAFSSRQLEEWVNGTLDEGLLPYTVRVRAECHYSGHLSFKGTRYKVILADTNVNGRFDDHVTASVCEHEDQLQLDGDTLFVWPNERFRLDRRQLLCNRLLLGEDLFYVHLRLKEKTITLSRVTERLNRVELPMAVEFLLIDTEEQGNSVSIVQPGKEIWLPRGRYRVLMYEAMRSNKRDKSFFRFWASASRRSPFVDVDEETGAALQFGEPFTPRTSVPPSSVRPLDGGVLEVTLVSRLEGSGRDLPSGMLKDPDAPADIFWANSYTIRDVDGAIVASGGFNMLTEGSFGYFKSVFEGWTVWSGAKANTEYSIECGFPTGPFELKRERQPLRIPQP
jgi:hypothetical protein